MAKAKDLPTMDEYLENQENRIVEHAKKAKSKQLYSVLDKVLDDVGSSTRTAPDVGFTKEDVEKAFQDGRKKGVSDVKAEIKAKEEEAAKKLAEEDEKANQALIEKAKGGDAGALAIVLARNTTKDLQARLKKKNIAFETDANKDKLVVLLIENKAWVVALLK